MIQDRDDDAPGAGGPVSEDDMRLLGELRDAFDRTEAPPLFVVEAGKAVFGLRDLDAELAWLTWDSEIDAAAQLVRGAAVLDPARSMTFELDDFSVEIEIGPAEQGRPLTGQLIPPRSAQVELEQSGGPGGPIHLDADDLGRFGRASIPAGLVRLRVLREGFRPVVTSWVRIV